MFDENIHHAFDDFVFHTYILNSNNKTDIKWIDWGKPYYLDENDSILDFRVNSHFRFLLEHIRTVTFAEITYYEFRKYIISKGLKKYDISNIFKNLEDYFINPKYVFNKSWKEFFVGLEKHFPN